MQMRIAGAFALALTLVSVRPASAIVLLRTALGPETGDEFGRAIAGLDDLNGDAVPDLAVGAPGHAPTAGFETGAVYLVSGKDGAILDRIDGEGDGDRFGEAVAAIEDLSGDGLRDLIVGAPRHDGPAGADSGKVYVYNAATQVPIRTHDGEGANDLFGTSVAAGANVDGDSVDDVLAGAPAHQPVPGIPTGKAYAFSGATGAPLLAKEGEVVQIGAGIWPVAFGQSVAGVRDANGDGRDDVAVGSPAFTVFGLDLGAGVLDQRGRAYLLSGANGAVLQMQTGETVDDRLGRAVAGLDDLNADGRGEWAAGLPRVGAHPGAVRVYSGANGLVVHAFEGTADGDLFGIAVADAGETNGDGTGDVAIGASIAEQLHVRSGATGASLGTIGALEAFGLAVSGVGDLNGDGLADVAAGAPLHDGVGANSGAVFVYDVTGQLDCGQTGSLVPGKASGLLLVAALAPLAWLRRRAA